MHAPSMVTLRKGALFQIQRSGATESEIDQERRKIWPEQWRQEDSTAYVSIKDSIAYVGDVIATREMFEAHTGSGSRLDYADPHNTVYCPHNTVYCVDMDLYNTDAVDSDEEKKRLKKKFV